MSDPLATAHRTHRAGSLTRAHAGQSVRLGGWVHRVRDLGGILFIDLRDRDGLLQLSFDPRWTPAAGMATAATLGAESVILVEGKVEVRPEPARDEPGHQPRRLAESTRTQPERVVEQRRVPERHRAQRFRRAVVGDHRRRDAEQRLSQLARVRDRRRREQELGVGAVGAGEPPQTP